MHAGDLPSEVTAPQSEPRVPPEQTVEGIPLALQPSGPTGLSDEASRVLPVQRDHLRNEEEVAPQHQPIPQVQVLGPRRTGWNPPTCRTSARFTITVPVHVKNERRK